ncbi:MULTISPECIES: aldo/keto reductase [unclassified Mesorhizobium]|uniref:aldo/keto reductase n=1 Tax=unclassified Mesorhizobium TaxID=325217 RepID=UPI000FCA768C|nr:MULTISPECIES: aldo/keto reductase [unclassified Mesorhizobium]RUZ91419.1 oxidoreductase [Mesorhizobium sp. M7A.F.Ca.US.003.02.2.1]RUY98570.1 oxidoreductase [Mesorhizobium sp. M7A.F.Ca.CA.001.12.2.1]RUZ26109.1 oxidoreductase [Mesorhizobium sp. M7A.F.Ca.US.007.01.2.1]RUZ50067.1 oxidoreductase [Mesorhizobium sp. M7A.F.Ca.US.003.02.1.1]RUZ69576.1 oxidoreductase [Mesorhizobium sp. M7A.F.Ca.US.007.01.1.1]
MTATTPIRWGILGPGSIAQSFAGGVAASDTGKLVAIGARNPAKPGLAERFPGARILDGYDALLADPDIDAVYISIPHPDHAQWAIKAAEAGKHVLCEKPLALTAFEADAMMHAARKAGTFLGEAFMYRLHPQTKKLVELIRSGVIGEIRMIKSSFGFAMPGFMPQHRLYANDLAGGGILDVGGYPVSMVRLIAGAAVGKPFSEPDKVVGTAHLGQSGVDEWASALLHFPDGIVAEVSCSISLNQDNVLRILGTRGRIEVPDFWFAGGNRDVGLGRIDVIASDGTRQTISVDEKRHVYSFEVDAAGEAIRAGGQEFAWPGMAWAESLGTLRVLDKWRTAAGLEYGIEKAEQRTNTISGRPLRSGGTAVAKRTIPGLSKPASVVALGFEDFRTFSSGSILLDAFFEAGGNLFDTGYVYGGGYTEKLLGEWLKNRGVRAQSVVIAKGAHSPLCYPDVIGKQLDQTLERLQTDHVDVYFMHRDNPDVPVGEFVDAMDREVKAGRIRGPFGGSNWTMERLDEAIAYAERTGKQKPGALSNNFSLAEMLEPIWAGCVTSSTDAWKAWLTSRQMPNFAWSSQGRGFFTDRAGRDKQDNEELVRVWYSERNFGRRDRAIELAARLGKSPIHIALAYVLAQPFPSIPLIGPRTLDELDDSLRALDITLSQADLEWLDGGSLRAA